MQKLLNLPQNIIPLCAVVMGYPTDEPKAIDTFHPDRIYSETWYNG